MHRRSFSNKLSKWDATPSCPSTATFRPTAAANAAIRKSSSLLSLERPVSSCNQTTFRLYKAKHTWCLIMYGNNKRKQFLFLFEGPRSSSYKRPKQLLEIITLVSLYFSCICNISDYKMKTRLVRSSHVLKLKKTHRNTHDAKTGNDRFI
mmetsp:Transcript_3969/g.8272  ORF Transcript_3969/g.8272 Transcript_3969/m.8272 type:complete len:150 (-) Transcript_3969:827-1276(-)